MVNREIYRYNSVAVAKYIAATANERRISINITKIQKLLYIAYGIFLAVRDTRLTNEYPEAWPYGPVFPTTRTRLLKVDLYSISKKDVELKPLEEDQDFNSLIDLVFRVFGSWSAGQLTAWSHGDGTPWNKTTKMPHFHWGDTIPDEYIRPYFASMISHNE